MPEIRKDEHGSQRKIIIPSAPPQRYLHIPASSIHNPKRQNRTHPNQHILMFFSQDRVKDLPEISNPGGRQCPIEDQHGDGQ